MLIWGLSGVAKSPPVARLTSSRSLQELSLPRDAFGVSIPERHSDSFSSGQIKWFRGWVCRSPGTILNALDFSTSLTRTTTFPRTPQTPTTASADNLLPVPLRKVVDGLRILSPWFVRGSRRRGWCSPRRRPRRVPSRRCVRERHPGWVFGRMTGAQALTEALLTRRRRVRVRHPRAQENELWDTFKDKGVAVPARDARVLAPRAWPTATPAAPGGPACCASCPAPASRTRSPAWAKRCSIRRPSWRSSVMWPTARRPGRSRFTALESGRVAQAGVQVRVPGADGRADPGRGAAGVHHGDERRTRTGRGGGAVQPVHRSRTTSARPPPAPPAPPFDEVAFEQALPLLADQKHRDRHLRRRRLHGLRHRTRGGRGAASSTGRHERVRRRVRSATAHPLAVGWGYGRTRRRSPRRIFAGDKRHPLKSGVDTAARDRCEVQRSLDRATTATRSRSAWFTSTRTPATSAEVCRPTCAFTLTRACSSVDCWRAESRFAGLRTTHSRHASAN